MALKMIKFLQMHRNLLKYCVPRHLSTTGCLEGNYEGDGKTTVTILNREYKHIVMFDSFSSYGFRLNNGIFTVGPVAAFPRTMLHWNVSSIEDLTPKSFSLFSVLEPKLDLFILGTGDKKLQPSPEVMSFFEANKITTEILPTEEACSTFNFLNAEGRCIAGAFIPPTEVRIYEDEFQVSDSSAAISPFGNEK